MYNVVYIYIYIYVYIYIGADALLEAMNRDYESFWQLMASIHDSFCECYEQVHDAFCVSLFLSNKVVCLCAGNINWRYVISTIIVLTEMFDHS